MLRLPTAVLLASLPALVAASTSEMHNQPCTTTGSCTFARDEHNIHESPYVFHIRATDPTHIGDLTESAGFLVVRCEPSGLDLRDTRIDVVCADKEKSEHCDHIDKGDLRDKVVKLPRSCGNPFGRIKRSWISEDQSLSSNLRKRDIYNPQVRSFIVGYDFENHPMEKRIDFVLATAPTRRSLDNLGPVVKRTLGGNIRHASKRQLEVAAVDDWHRLTQRSLIIDGVDVCKELKADFRELGNDIKRLGSKIKEKLKGAKETVEDVAEACFGVFEAIGDGVDAATGAFIEAIDVLADETSFNKNFKFKKNIAFEQKLDFKKEVSDKCDLPLVPGSKPKPKTPDGEDFVGRWFRDAEGENQGVSGEAALSIQAELKPNIKTEVGFIIVGQLFPPKVSEFSVTGHMDGELESDFKIGGFMQGRLSTGDVPLAELPLGGVVIPGIVSVGPKVGIYGRLMMKAELAVDLSLKNKVNIKRVDFAHPKRADTPNVVDIEKVDTAPAGANLGLEVKAKVEASAHVMPRISVGVNLLTFGKATVYAQIDAYATIGCDLEASAGIEVIEGFDSAAVDAGFKGQFNEIVGFSVDIGTDASLGSFFESRNKVTLLQRAFKREQPFGTSPNAIPLKELFPSATTASAAKVKSMTKEIAGSINDNVGSASGTLGRRMMFAKRQQNMQEVDDFLKELGDYQGLKFETAKEELFEAKEDLANLECAKSAPGRLVRPLDATLVA